MQKDDDASDEPESEESGGVQVSGSETRVLATEATGVRQQKSDGDENSCIICGGESTRDEREIHSGQKKNSPSMSTVDKQSLRQGDKQKVQYEILAVGPKEADL